MFKKGNSKNKIQKKLQFIKFLIMNNFIIQKKKKKKKVRLKL